MSAKRVEELDRTLRGESYTRGGDGRDRADELPEPTPEMIENVCAGYLMSSRRGV
jgi:hypothetical protein